MEDRLARVEHEIFGNGRDGLELRMKYYVDRETAAIEGKQDIRHTENTRKIDRLAWMVGVGVGIVITLNAVVLGRLH